MTTRRRAIGPAGTWLSLVLPLLLVLGVSGCSGPGTSAASPTSSTTAPATGAPDATAATGHAATPEPPTVVDGLGLSILQNRPDYVTRVLQLSVTNEGSEPVTVVGARFSAPQFTADASWTKGTSVEIPAGLTRQFPVQLPAAVCPAPADGAPTLVITIADASGTPREVTGRPADPFAVLPRIAGEDCLDEAVAGIAALSLDDALEVTGTGADSVAHLRLRVDPSGGGSGELQLDEVRYTILLTPAEGATWPLDATIAGGDAPREFTLDAVPARCDPHAIAEDKRGTVLPVAVAVAGGPSGVVSVPASDTLRLALYTYITQHCGFGDAPSG